MHPKEGVMSGSNSQHSIAIGTYPEEWCAAGRWCKPRVQRVWGSRCRVT